ncbi:hypothetical protein BGZ93_003522 [Podila epicladia]|nr:hypothetical protein BGZ93_003522 [Podila epicladia]
MSELSAKMSKHLHYNSVMPLSEANLSKHTLQSPPSREAKLKHILIYVDLQRELALEEQADLEERNMSLDRKTPSPSSPNTGANTNAFATRSSPLSPTLSSITKDNEKERKEEMASTLHNNLHLLHSSKTPETTPHTAHDSQHQYQLYEKQKHLHNHEGQQQQQKKDEEEAHLHEKQISKRPTSPGLYTGRSLSSSVMPRQYADVDPFHPQQQTQPLNHNLIQNNTAFHHFRHGPHPNPLDPSLALPRALPRSMLHQERMFLSDDGTGQTLTPPSSPPPHFRPRRSISPSPINILFEPSTPFKHEKVPEHRSESPVAQSPSPTTPSEKKSRFSRFSFLGRSTPRTQNHKRHESVPATKADPWLNAKDRERSKFHSLSYRSGSRMAVSGPGMEIAGVFDDSRYDQHQQPPQPSQPLSPKSSKVKRLFQDIFKSSSSSSTRNKKATMHTAREISLPSTYLGQQPESALEGSPQAQSYYNPRHSLIRNSAAPIPLSYPVKTTSPPPPPQKQQQQQEASQNNYTHHRNSRPPTSLSTYMRESLVDPVQQLSHYRPLSSSLEQPQLQSSLYYYPDHQQQHYQNMELQLQQQQQQQQTKEERRGLLHHYNDAMDDEDDDYMRAYAPYAQASLTPPPASSVVRHSTSSNRIFGLMSEDFDQPSGSNNTGTGGCRSRPRTRPSSQLIAPVQRADLEGLLRQAPIVVV